MKNSEKEKCADECIEFLKTKGVDQKDLSRVFSCAYRAARKKYGKK
jgi:hypothetical protein